MDATASTVGPVSVARESRRFWANPPRLTVVIPALNEEDSIRSIIERCQAARDQICRTGSVRDVEIIVVSDGSTDRTAEIAQECAANDPGVSVVVFPVNRGYGAALKEGFRRGSGELVSFLDADGTCDPLYLGEMCRAIQLDDAAIVLGSRMGSNSEMPAIRRLGNRAYAFMLGLLSGQAVTDTASGMRVIRRDVLPDLYPLPDGLHFTPAMSARAFVTDLRVVEIEMRYSERTGESKLNVMRDGVRFLASILDAILLYRPARFFALAATLCLVVGAFWATYPVEFYLRERRLEEWMIYRVLLSGFLFACAFVLTTSGVLAEQITGLSYRRRRQTFVGQLVNRLFSTRSLLLTVPVTAIAAVLFVWPGLVEYARTGHVTLHWSRVAAAIFLLNIAVFSVIAVVLQRIVGLWKTELEHLGRDHDAR